MINNYGGKRMNAGRKPKQPGEKAVRINITLPNDVMEILKQQKNTSKYIADLIRADQCNQFVEEMKNSKGHE